MPCHCPPLLGERAGVACRKAAVFQATRSLQLNLSPTQSNARRSSAVSIRECMADPRNSSPLGRESSRPGKGTSATRAWLCRRNVWHSVLGLCGTSPVRSDARGLIRWRLLALPGCCGSSNSPRSCATGSGSDSGMRHCGRWSESMKGSKAKTGMRPGRKEVVGRTRNGLWAGAKIVAAIEDATEILRTEGLQSKRLTIRTYKVPSAPRVCRLVTSSEYANCWGRARRLWLGFWGLMSTRCDRGSRESACRSQSLAASFRRSSRTQPIGDVESGKALSRLNRGTGPRTDCFRVHL